MAAEARQEPPEAPAAGCYETTSRAELPAHDLAGIRWATAAAHRKALHAVSGMQQPAPVLPLQGVDA